MVKPPPIREGAAVGIVAPSSPFDRQAFLRGLSVLETLGFRPVPGERLYLRNGHLAGTDRDRAEDLEEMVRNPAVSAVMAARGGFGALRLADLLDLELFRRHPKPFVGFSDLTVMLTVLSQRVGLIAFHGPVVTSLARISPPSLASFRTMLTAERFPPLEWEETVEVRPGRARGRLTGGNLTTLCHLVGTPFEPSFDGCILLLEDVHEPLYRVDRMLTHLHLAGKLAGVRGFLLGDFEGVEEISRVWERVLELAPPQAPVWGNLPLGHGAHNFTWPLGAEASLEHRGVVRFHHED